MKNEKILTKKSIVILVFVLFLIVTGILLLNKYRPVSTFTIYQVGVQKEKVATARSLDEAKRIMVKYADKKEKINALVENDKGTRVAIAYGIVNLRPKTEEKQNSSYYFEYMDRVQSTDFSYAADGLYQNTRFLDGKLYVLFQQAAVLGLIPLDEVEILNMFDEEEVASFSSYEVKSGYLYHHVSTNVKKPKTSVSIPLGKVPFYLTDGTYYSWDGQRFFHDYTMLIDSKRDFATPPKDSWIGFNTHYLYTSLSQETNYTADELEKYISENLDKDSPYHKAAPLFFQAQKTYNVNAIALFAACQASGYTTSQEILDFAKTMSESYCNKKDSQYTGDFFGNKAVGMNVSYSPDPYWGEKAVSYYFKMDDVMGQKDMVLLASPDKDQ